MKKTKVASGGENVIDPKFFNLVSQVAHFSAMYGIVLSFGKFWHWTGIAVDAHRIAIVGRIARTQCVRMDVATRNAMGPLAPKKLFDTGNRRYHTFFKAVRNALRVSCEELSPLKTLSRHAGAGRR